MAIPKFPLKMQDGAQVRSIEELREHAALWTLEQCYQDGRLVRWLTVQRYPDLAEAVRQLDTAVGDFHPRLCEVLGVAYTEELEEAFKKKEIEIKEAEAKEAESIPSAFKMIRQIRQTIGPILEDLKTVFPPATPVMSDEVADKIADLIDGDGTYSDYGTFYETEEDIICFNAHSKLELLNTPLTKDAYSKGNHFSPLFLMFYSGVSLKISKRTGVAEDFAISWEKKETSLEIGRTAEYVACGKSIVYFQNERLIKLDTEMKKVTVLENWLEISAMARTASQNTIAFCDKSGICLYDVETKEKTRVTAHGKKIMAGGLALTDDALYFACHESAGNLDDGKTRLAVSAYMTESCINQKFCRERHSPTHHIYLKTYTSLATEWHILIGPVLTHFGNTSI